VGVDGAGKRGAYSLLRSLDVGMGAQGSDGKIDQWMEVVEAWRRFAVVTR